MNQKMFDEMITGIEEAMAFAGGARVAGPRISRRIGIHDFSVHYDAESECFIGTVHPYPGLSATGDDIDDAFREIARLVASL